MTSDIHNWVLFLLWLCLFIFSVVISPLISSSILGTYWSGEFIFQCPICLFAFSYCSWGSQGKNTEVVFQSLLWLTTFCQNSPPWPICLWWLSGAIMGGPARDEVMKKIPDRQGRPRPHPWRGHEENTWQARPSRIRDPPGWPRPLPHPISSPLFCCCSCLPCCGFLCCLPRALLLLFHWMRTNLKP